MKIIKNNVGADDSVRPQHKRNTKKGITLVALVITLIVLLILAVVTITIVTNSGLITKASNATSQHTIAAEKEAIRIGYAAYNVAKESGKESELEVDGAKTTTQDEEWNIIFDKTNNEYILSRDGNILLTKQNGVDVIWTDNGDGTFTKGETTLKIGDYVNYDATKDKNGNEIIGEKAKYISYSEKNASTEKNGGRSSGYTNNQVFNLSNYSAGWRVLGIENGSIRLISADIIGKHKWK